MFDFYVNRHIFQLFGLNFLWDLNISCGLDTQIHGEKDCGLDSQIHGKKDCGLDPQIHGEKDSPFSSLFSPKMPLNLLKKWPPFFHFCPLLKSGHYVVEVEVKNMCVFFIPLCNTL